MLGEIVEVILHDLRSNSTPGEVAATESKCKEGADIAKEAATSSSGSPVKRGDEWGNQFMRLDLCWKLLEGLTKAGRFGLSMKLLSKQHKQALAELVAYLKEHGNAPW